MTAVNIFVFSNMYCMTRNAGAMYNKISSNW